MTVTITSADWQSNEKMHDLMIEVIAGTFERGTYKDCVDIEEQGPDRYRWKLCSTMDQAKLAIPGGFHMEVEFNSTTVTAAYICKDIRGDVEGWLEGKMQGIGKAAQAGKLRKDVRCLKAQSVY
jgi:hypothetical protein